MKRFQVSIILLSLALSGSAFAQQEENYDYFSANRTMIRNGVQAVLMCNGLFTGERSLEQVFGQELIYPAIFQKMYCVRQLTLELIVPALFRGLYQRVRVSVDDVTPDGSRLAAKGAIRCLSTLTGDLSNRGRH